MSTLVRMMRIVGMVVATSPALMLLTASIQQPTNDDEGDDSDEDGEDDEDDGDHLSRLDVPDSDHMPTNHLVC